MIQQINNKFTDNDFVGAGEIDLLEFLIYTLHWKLIWNSEETQQ